MTVRHISHMHFRLSIIFIAYFVITGMSAAVTEAATVRTGIVNQLNADEVVEGDLIVIGDVIRVSGNVRGDAYLLGADVLVDGTIEGDVIASGGMIRISGNVEENVRAIAGVIEHAGSIGETLSVVAGVLKLLPDSTVGRNVVGVANSTTVDTSLGGDLVGVFRTLVVNNSVAGDIFVRVEKLILGESAQIQGSLTYQSSQSFDEVVEEKVVGEVVKLTDTVQSQSNSNDVVSRLFRVFSQYHLYLIAFLVGEVILGMLVISLFPNVSLRSVAFIETHSLKSFVQGLVWLIGMPMVTMLMSFTVIGIPLALMTALLFILMMGMSYLLFCYWVGIKILMTLKRDAHKSLTFMIGSLVMYILLSIDFVGLVMGIVAMSMGMGSLVQALQKTYSSARKLKIF